jgi:hypothetical protein
MSWTVYMTVVASICFIFDMRGVNGDATGFLFGSFVYLIVVGEFGSAFRSHDLGNGRR